MGSSLQLHGRAKRASLPCNGICFIRSRRPKPIATSYVISVRCSDHTLANQREPAGAVYHFSDRAVALTV